jgi:hypothetical protein
MIKKISMSTKWCVASRVERHRYEVHRKTSNTTTPTVIKNCYLFDDLVSTRNADDITHFGASLLPVGIFCNTYASSIAQTSPNGRKLLHSSSDNLIKNVSSFAECTS